MYRIILTLNCSALSASKVGCFRGEQDWLTPLAPAKTFSDFEGHSSGASANRNDLRVEGVRTVHCDPILEHDRLPEILRPCRARMPVVELVPVIRKRRTILEFDRECVPIRIPGNRAISAKKHNLRFGSGVRVNLHCLVAAKNRNRVRVSNLVPLSDLCLLARTRP